MGNDDSGENKRHHGKGAESDSLLAAIPPDGTAGRADQENRTDRSNGGGQERQGPARKLLGRLTINEWLTLLVGVGSLIVSYLTYQTARDTSDVQSAIKQIAKLADETKRQADNSDAQVKALSAQFGEMQTQTKAFQDSAGAAQGQLSETRLEQRAWIVTDSFLQWRWLKDEQGKNTKFMIFAIANLTNNGNSPATDVATFFEPFWFWPTFEKDTPAERVIEMTQQHFDPNTTCDRLPKAAEFQTVWPKRAPLGVSGGYTQEAAVPEYFTGHAFYGFRGCVRYKTLGTFHLTKFCTIYQHDPEQPAQNGRWGLCPGNGQQEAN